MNISGYFKPHDADAKHLGSSSAVLRGKHNMSMAIAVIDFTLL